jgi:hypothetical protein
LRLTDVTLLLFIWRDRNNILARSPKFGEVSANLANKFINKKTNVIYFLAFIKSGYATIKLIKLVLNFKGKELHKILGAN